MEDIESILPNNCTIPINPCRETTFLTSASSEYERASLQAVPTHHRVPWNVDYATPPPAFPASSREPRSISQLINRREDSLTSDADTELEGLRTSDHGKSPSLSKSARSEISLGNAFVRVLPHNKIVPHDSVLPYRLNLPNASTCSMKVTTNINYYLS